MAKPTGKTPNRAPRAKSAPAKPVAAAAPVAPKPVVTPAPEAKMAQAAPKPVSAPVAAPVKVTPAPADPAPVAPVVETVAPDPVPEPIIVPEPTQPEQPKEPVMATIPSFDFAEPFKTAFADMQTKAQETIEKSQAAFGDYNDFAKGNVEAVVESGKILAGGLQEMTSGLVADSRSAFESMTAEVKELAAAKTPSDFFKLHNDLMKKHFDTAVAFSSKQSEAVLKLAGEVVAPISSRVSLAVDKVKSGN
ncbi:phasin family protein [Novosphingobium sp. FSY-8]|uniref:Phasin family protein n=1 Tax=Novosphingobium ovatum TaxID=1908523 RepID=A0ABW9XF65_9SPHN|nr:phasin family protein [Novosphingobium ovatum]NBC37144.1 phasin family protein [Novosphingobium ovatum]